MTETRGMNEGKRMSNSRFGRAGWLIILPVVVFALPTILLIGLAMLPSFAAYMSDGRREKYATLCVGGFNFAATIPYIFKLWSFGVGSAGLQIVLTNVWMWLIIYLSAAVGWFVFWAIPGVVAHVSRWHNHRALQAMVERQKELIAEWGPNLIDPDHRMNKDGQ